MSLFYTAYTFIGGDCDREFLCKIREESLPEERECLNHVLAYSIYMGRGEKATVGELILGYAHAIKKDQTEDAYHIQSKLISHGVKIKENDVFISSTHPKLREAYSNSEKWINNWDRVLMRLPFVKRVAKPMSFSGVLTKAVKVENILENIKGAKDEGRTDS